MSRPALGLRSGIIELGRRLFRKVAGNRSCDFRALFGQFRRVLDLHNTAAERIADMGEKLSGEYIFDIVYIRQSYNELHRVFAALLSQFSLLTKDRYRGLGRRLEGIDHEVRRLIDDNGEPSTDLVVPLASARMSRLQDVGGKMANLGSLGNLAGITIPQGFVITTRSFDDFMQHNGLTAQVDRLIDDWETNTASFERVQTAIRSGALPPAVHDAIAGALQALTNGPHQGFLAVRSSAVGEDGEFSFAGQFETVLNVPPDMQSLTTAYKEVVASLFSARPFHYCKEIGCNAAEIRMAVGCIRMIDATASGVTYSADPSGHPEDMLINAAWGLGKAVVEGQVDADAYRVAKSLRPSLRERRIGAKTKMVIPALRGGTVLVDTPADLACRAVIDDRTLMNLANQALTIEEHLRQPQDIEWAMDRSGHITVLQARPIAVRSESGAATRNIPPDSLVVIQTFSGIPARKGTGAGRVFIPDTPDSLDAFPKGGVLVAKNDSSQFVRVMPYASAILTDQGTPTSHMASLCREFRVPTLVNCGNATGSLRNGQEITVRVEESGAVVYEGIHRELTGDGEGKSIDELYEFRRKKYLLRHILPLNLVDPFRDDFTPEACRTLHDILRFVHEKMVIELVEAAEQGLTDRSAVHLELPVPAGIVVIDLGGGIGLPEGAKTATMERVTSVPFRALIEGMTDPGAWHTDMVALQAGDLIAGMMKLADITAPSARVPTANLAIVSHEYLNLSLKFGYHFTMLDCYCSPDRTNNHIYFRFSGGATDITKRSRRARLIENILKTYGFICQIQGAVITARISNIGDVEMTGILDRVGRLLAYSRQLDAVLHTDESVARYSRSFLNGDYRL